MAEDVATAEPPAGKVKSLTVEVSYDDGKTWPVENLGSSDATSTVHQPSRGRQQPLGDGPVVALRVVHPHLAETLALALLEQAVRFFFGHLVLRRHVRQQQAQP